MDSNEGTLEFTVCDFSASVSKTGSGDVWMSYVLDKTSLGGWGLSQNILKDTIETYSSCSWVDSNSITIYGKLIVGHYNI